MEKQTANVFKAMPLVETTHVVKTKKGKDKLVTVVELNDGTLIELWHDKPFVDNTPIIIESWLFEGDMYYGVYGANRKK